MKKKKMTSSTTTPVILLLLLLSFSAAAADSQASIPDFLKCLSTFPFIPSTTADDTIIFSSSSSDPAPFSGILHSSVRNKRFETPTTPTPSVIIRPLNISHVGPTVICARSNNLILRVRSGGHDYEGLSYVSSSSRPFVLLDLVDLSDVTIDPSARTAWIQSGATVGQVYYRLGQASSTLAFPAGVNPTVGIGGHLSGGGTGTLLRYAGVAADHVTDVVAVDPEGRVLNRTGLGDDVFWAIRGGGGNTFGVVLAWKVDLVNVPEIVTVATVFTNARDDHGRQCLATWQQVAPTLPDELLVRVVISKQTNGTVTSSLTVMYNIFYVGRSVEAISVLRERFPELGVVETDLLEMPWVRTTVYFAEYGADALDLLLSRIPRSPVKYFKGKSDYVTKAIPESGLEGMWKIMLRDDIEEARLTLTPFGGKMARVSEASIPFPHRGGNLFEINYLVSWAKDGEAEGDRHVRWIRDMYAYMTPYVSSNPRAAYVNYRDMDIGSNNPHDITTYKQGRVWGEKYFKTNYDRLVRIKTAFDPTNFFSNEQSIPSLRARRNGHRKKNKAPEGDRGFYIWSYFLLVFSLLWYIIYV